MIISHTHRYIFFAIPKTGTHAIRRALRPHLDENDPEQVGLFVSKSFPWPEIAAIKHGHITARQIRPVLGADAFDAYFKFAFVRNPFERFVSYCAFMARSNGLFAANPRSYMRAILTQARPFDHILFRPQSDFVTDANGHLMVDFIGRVEHLQADYDSICDRIGLPRSELERVNESSHRDYRDYYDPELISQVTNLYSADLELFDYAFDRHAAAANTQSA